MRATRQMEVRAKLKFITPCLGNERNEQRDMMLRGPNGKVVMLQSWWRSSLVFAASALGRFTKEVEHIQVDPEIEGTTSIYRRWYSSSSFKEHEAFLVGSEIEARFWLPSGLRIEDLRALLETAGKYAGLSPYGFKKDYGRFLVASMEAMSSHHGNGQH